MQSWAIHHADAHWQTMAFTVLCFSQLGHVMAIRSSHKSFFTLGISSNIPMLGALLVTIALQLAVIYVPFFNDIFKTQPLSLKELGIASGVSALFVGSRNENDRRYLRRELTV